MHYCCLRSQINKVISVHMFCSACTPVYAVPWWEGKVKVRRRLRKDFRLQNSDYIMRAALFSAAETSTWSYLHLHRQHQPASSASIDIMFTSRDPQRPFMPTPCQEMRLDNLELLTEGIIRYIATLKLSNADKCVVPIGIMTGYID